MSDKSLYETKLAEIKEIDCERIKLRHFNLGDVDDVFEYSKDEEVVKYLTWEAHQDIEQTTKTFTDFFLVGSGIYAIELKSEKKVIGCIDFRVDAAHDKGSFGYVLHREYWNRGYMTEALKAIIDMAFNDLGVNRVEATHYVGNEQSGKVMEKVGMNREGLALKEVKIKGKYMDVVHYGILNSERE